MPLLFDGSTSIVNCGSASSLDNIFTGGGTLMAWINPASFGPNSFGRILNTADTTAIVDGWSLIFNDNSATETFGLTIDFSTTNGSWVAPASSITLGIWQHIAVAYDSGSTANNPTLYVNGAAVSETELTTPVGTVDSDAANDFLIGNIPDRSRTFDGEMEDARAYTRILAASEVQDIFATNGRDNIVTGLAGRWKMFGVAGGGEWVRSDSVESDTGNTLVVPIPGGVVGELKMIVAGAAGDATNHSGEAADYATPSGWTLRNLTQDTAATALSRPSFFVFIRTAAAGDPSTVTLTQSFPSAPTTSITTKGAISLRFPTAIATSADVTYGISIATTATPASLSITPSAAAMAVWTVTRDDDDGPTGPLADIYPSGTAGINSFAEISADNNGMTMAVAVESVASGATGGRTWNPDGGTEESISGSDAYLGTVDATPIKDDSPNANHGTADSSLRYTASERTFSRRRRVA